MGNQQSISNAVSETINNSMTNVLMKSSQNCTQTNISSQNMNFEGITAKDGCSLSFTGIKQEAKQSPNFTCAMNSSNSSELSNSLKTKLEQDASAKVSGVGGALNSQAMSSTINTAINNIVTNVDISNVSNCVQDNLNTQTMNFQNIQASCPAYCRNPKLCEGLPASICDMNKCEVKYADIEQNMVQEAVASCLSTNTTVQKAVNDITAEVKQTTTSEAKGVDPTALLLSSILPSLIISCIILSSVAFLFMGGMGKSGKNPVQDKMMTYTEGGLDSTVGTTTDLME
jgi:hypothetical protein